MNEIINYIDSRYQLCYPEFKYFGLGEITDKSKDRFPVTVDTRDKISLNDRYDAVVWHREISGSAVDNEDFSFGLRTEKQFNVTIRTIVAYKVELGEQLKFDFIDSFPQLEVGDVEGYLLMDVSPGSINLDHEAVAEQEQIHTRYEKSRICWNIFSFDNEIQFIQCPDSSPACNR